MQFTATPVTYLYKLQGLHRLTAAPKKTFTVGIVLIAQFSNSYSVLFFSQKKTPINFSEYILIILTKQISLTGDY